MNQIRIITLVAALCGIFILSGNGCPSDPSAPASTPAAAPRVGVVFSAYDKSKGPTECGVSVTIRTPNFKLVSVTHDDKANVAALFADPVVMAKFGAGKPRPETDTYKAMDDVQIKRWRDGDPLSSFAVFDSANQFMGWFNIGYGWYRKDLNEQSAEVAGLSHKESWNSGFAKEVFQTVIYSYVSALQEVAKLKGDARTQFLGGGFVKDDFKMPRYITATASYDNDASWRLLDGCCFGPKCPELASCGKQEGVTMNQLVQLGFEKGDAKKFYNIEVPNPKKAGDCLLRTCENRPVEGTSDKVVKMHFVLDLTGDAFLDQLRGFRANP